MISLPPTFMISFISTKFDFESCGWKTLKKINLSNEFHLFLKHQEI